MHACWCQYHHIDASGMCRKVFVKLTLYLRCIRVPAQSKCRRKLSARQDLTADQRVFMFNWNLHLHNSPVHADWQVLSPVSLVLQKGSQSNWQIACIEKQADTDAVHPFACRCQSHAGHLRTTTGLFWGKACPCVAYSPATWSTSTSTACWTLSNWMPASKSWRSRPTRMPLNDRQCCLPYTPGICTVLDTY